MSKKRKYRFKSVAGAERRIAQLEKQIDEWAAIVNRLHAERRALARLAAEGPAFDNPLIAMKAKRLRDDLLATMGMNPDGSFRR